MSKIRVISSLTEIVERPPSDTLSVERLVSPLVTNAKPPGHLGSKSAALDD